MSDLHQHLSLLADPIRLRILAVLSREELGVGELVRVLGLPQSTVSRHLKALRLGDWIARRQDGTSGRYRVETVPAEAQALWTAVLGQLAETDQYREDDERLQGVLAMRQVDSRTFFGRVSGQWEALRRELFGDDFWLPTLLAALPDDQVWADLGCGTGETVARLAPNVGRVIGVDQEPLMLEQAKERCAGFDNVELFSGGLECLPVDDARVDVAVCMLVLHHLEHPARAMAEARRILRPGGRLVVLDLDAHDRELYRQTMGHRHLGFSAPALAALAAEAGLSVRRRRLLPRSEDVQGPPLFVAVLS